MHKISYSGKKITQDFLDKYENQWYFSYGTSISVEAFTCKFPIPILRSYLCVHNTIYFVLNESRIPLIDFTHFLSIMFGEKEPLDLNV